MDAFRLRFGAIVEWALAAAVILALAALGSFLAREYRTVAGVIPINVRAIEAPTPLIAPPASIPPGAVSLPMLLLSEGRELRIGETVSAITRRLGAAAEIAPPAVERAPHGERVTRTYQAAAGFRFTLVFEPFEKNAEPRLAAIYR